MCTGDLRVIIMHGSRAHDQRRTFDVFRLVLIGDLRAHGLKAGRYIRAQTIRSADGYAAAEQQLGQRIHGYTADADQMDFFFILNIWFDRQGHAANPSCFCCVFTCLSLLGIL